MLSLPLFMVFCVVILTIFVVTINDPVFMAVMAIVFGVFGILRYVSFRHQQRVVRSSGDPVAYEDGLVAGGSALVGFAMCAISLSSLFFLFFF